MATTSYKYAGQGWNDPLAQEVYKKYNPDMLKKGPGVGGISPFDQLVSGTPQHATNNYGSPLDPSSWGVNRRGTTYDQMKAEYVARGGQGTLEQQLKQNEADSNAQAAAQTAASGSTHMLSPDVLAKMWR